MGPFPTGFQLSTNPSVSPVAAEDVYAALGLSTRPKVPTWALVAGVALVLLFAMKRGGR